MPRPYKRRVPTWGSPNLDDAAGRIEKIANRAFERMFEFVDKRGPQIINRQPGTLPAPDWAQTVKYIEVASDPMKVAELYKAQVARLGAAAGLLEVVKYFERQSQKAATLEDKAAIETEQPQVPQEAEEGDDSWLQ